MKFEREKPTTQTFKLIYEFSLTLFPLRLCLPEPSQIEVRLLLAYSSSSTSLSSASKLGWSDSIDALPPPEATVEGTIPFSKSVKVFIMPKPARR